MTKTMKELRAIAGHTQEGAAKYLYTNPRQIRRYESGDVSNQARLELYELKLKQDGFL